MSVERQIFLLVVALVTLMVVAVVVTRAPKPLREKRFVRQWRDLQLHCKDKTCWPKALKEADTLMDRALKKRKFKGKTTGERMVSAQRTFTDNDAAWFAHNVYKKVKADPEYKLRESDVKNALVGFRQALRDLGALPDGSKPKDG